VRKPDQHLTCSGDLLPAARKGVFLCQGSAFQAATLLLDILLQSRRCEWSHSDHLLLIVGHYALLELYRSMFGDGARSIDPPYPAMAEPTMIDHLEHGC
jgi:hypothetical protein